MSSLQRCTGLPTDLTPFICHSVLLIVHLLSFIRAMCPVHFHFVLVTYWTMSVILVLCLMIGLWILSFRLTSSIFLSIAWWLVSSFFTNAFVRDYGIHMPLLVRHSGYRPFFVDSWKVPVQEDFLYSPKTLHPAFILIETSCFAIVCPRYL